MSPLQGGIKDTHLTICLYLFMQPIIEAAFTSEEKITPQSLSELPFLVARLAETNSIYPARLSR